MHDQQAVGRAVCVHCSDWIVCATDGFSPYTEGLMEEIQANDLSAFKTLLYGGARYVTDAQIRHVKIKGMQPWVTGRVNVCTD